MSFGMELGLALMEIDDDEAFDTSVFLCEKCGFDLRMDPLKQHSCSEKHHVDQQNPR